MTYLRIKIAIHSKQKEKKTLKRYKTIQNYDNY